MAEPTPGQRIAEAAAGCIIAEIDHGAGSPEAVEVWADLLTLCDRADAAERLARAVDTAAGDREVNDWSYDARRLDEYNNALAAWRALGEVDG